MQITYIHQYFNTSQMAGGTRSLEMAKRFIEMGHEVNVITSWRDESKRLDWFITDVSGIKVHWLPVDYSNHMSYRERIIAFVKFAVLSARRAASLTADVVFATSTPLTIAIPGIYASWKIGIPMVFEVRDLWPELPIAIGAIQNSLTKKVARWLESWAYQHSEAVVALSPGMRDGICRTGYPAERVAVIPNCSDIALFNVQYSYGQAFRRARSWLGDRPLIIYAGAFGKINGAGYFIDIAASMKTVSPEVRFLLIGDGFEKTAIETRASNMNVLGINLFIEDQIPKQEVPALYSAADIVSSLFIDMPEMRANSANKFFDTLAAGKPCLLNYGGWQSDLVLSAGCGLVTWQMSSFDAAVEIAGRINDKVWLSEAGISAKRLAVKYFDRDQLAKQLIAVLELATKKHGHLASTVAPGAYDTSSPVALR